MTGTMDPKANFTLVILQTELERFKFLVRSFLRARIAKACSPHPYQLNVLADKKTQIDKHALHYRDLSLSDPAILSPLEQQYLQSHQALLSSHYHASFLSSFPENLQKLDDTAGGISMIDKPDEDCAVFCRILRVAGTVEVNSESGVSEVEL
jgi:GINS complex subunit 4